MKTPDSEDSSYSSIKLSVTHCSNFSIDEKSEKEEKYGKRKIFEIKKINKVTWTREEDQVLFNILDFTKKGKWIFASMVLNYKKTPTECYQRFNKISKNFDKGKWTKDQDERLKSLFLKYGKKWKLIAKEMGNRSNKQVRNRFLDYLDDKITSVKFSQKDDQRLLNVYSEHGFNRKIFLESFPKRSFRKIRNRVVYLLKKRKGEKKKIASGVPAQGIVSSSCLSSPSFCSFGYSNSN